MTNKKNALLVLYLKNRYIVNLMYMCHNASLYVHIVPSRYKAKHDYINDSLQVLQLCSSSWLAANLLWPFSRHSESWGVHLSCILLYITSVLICLILILHVRNLILWWFILLCIISSKSHLSCTQDFRHTYKCSIIFPAHFPWQRKK